MTKTTVCPKCKFEMTSGFHIDNCDFIVEKVAALKKLSRPEMILQLCGATNSNCLSAYEYWWYPVLEKHMDLKPYEVWNDYNELTETDRMHICDNWKPTRHTDTLTIEGVELKIKVGIHHDKYVEWSSQPFYIPGINQNVVLDAWLISKEDEEYRWNGGLMAQYGGSFHSYRHETGDIEMVFDALVHQLKKLLEKEGSYDSLAEMMHSL